MVNFGKRLMADQIPEWKRYYINYKLMKKKVKQLVQQTQQGVKEKQQVLKEFSMVLDDQIEKIVLFLLEEQGILSSRIQALGEKRTALLEQPVLSQISDLREAYRAIGQDLLKLLRFLDTNATGIRKILKKFDRLMGYTFTDYYVTTRSDHPYSQLQQVFKDVGIKAVVGALSRNLTDVQGQHGSYLSIYDDPSIVLKDPVIDLIDAAVDKLTHSTSFLHFLGNNALIISDEISSSEDHPDDGSDHFISLLLNLVNTFLYMVNTYIIVPTADDYSLSLGAAATVCGVIIGSMAVAQVFSSIYFSAWSNKSYYKPLVFSSIMLLIGNTLYALAYDFNSLTVLLMGRLLCGLGSARAVNRRYINDCVPVKDRLKASAGFVSASALGMACGPALAGLLQVKFKMYAITFNQNTLPGWVLAFAWLFYLLWLWFSFKEPSHVDEGNHQNLNTGGDESAEMENGLCQSLLSGSKESRVEAEGQACGDSEEPFIVPANSIASAYRLLTPGVKVQLLIYFMLKYAMEILLSESSLVTTLYFGWTTSAEATFLAILGLTVLPVNVVVGRYIANMFEHRQILFASEIMVLVGVILSFRVTPSYSLAQYISSALLIFVSAEVLEGVNLSLMSRIMPSRLARGTYNGGLLSTEAGTLARVVADATITLAGYLREDLLLNVTLAPSLLICIASIAATYLTYNTLY